MKLSFFYLVSALTLPLATVSFVTTSCSKTEEIGPDLFRYENFNDPGDYTIVDGIKQYSFDTEWPKTKMPEGDKFFPWLFNDVNNIASPLPEPNNKNYPAIIPAKYFGKIINLLDFFYLIQSNSGDSSGNPSPPKTLNIKDINWKTIGINDWKPAELIYYYTDEQKSLSIICRNEVDKKEVDFSITNYSTQPTPPPSIPQIKNRKY